MAATLPVSLPDAMAGDEAGDDVAARIARLKTEMLDLDREYEREREELAGGTAGLASAPASSRPEHESEDTPVSSDVVHERISSMRQALSNLKDERSRLGIGLEGGDRRSLHKFAAGAQADEEPAGHDASGAGREPVMELAGAGDGRRELTATLLSAESSYLRYSVNQNVSSMTRHHREVTRVLNSAGGQPVARSSSASLRGLTSSSIPEWKAPVRGNKSQVSTLLEGGHPEVAEELRRRKAEKEERERLLRGASSGAGDSRAAAAAAAAAAVLESRKSSSHGKHGLKDPDTILEGLSRYTPRDAQRGAAEAAAQRARSRDGDKAALWAYRCACAGGTGLRSREREREQERLY